MEGERRLEGGAGRMLAPRLDFRGICDAQYLIGAILQGSCHAG